MKINKRLLFIPWVVLLAVSGCKIDHGLVPLNSRIEGMLSIDGEAPANTDEIRVAVTKDFPPNQINELFFSDRIDHTLDRAPYQIYLPPGTYQVVAVIWKEKHHAWNISDIVGLYGGQFIDDLLLPTYLPVTISDADAVRDHINIDVNLDRVNRDAVIAGTVTFQGTWPENTGATAIGAFSERPESDNFTDYYFKSVYIDYGIPEGADTYDFRLRVNGGQTIGYIAVLWIDDGYSLAGLNDLGYYPDPDNPDLPGTVPVPENGTVEGILFTIDFSNL